MHKQRAISSAWGTHPVVGLGRKDFYFFFLCSRKMWCCRQDVLREEWRFALFLVLFPKLPP